MKLSKNKIHPLDAIVGLKQLDDRSVNLVVTDPPYGIASSKKITVSHGKIVSTDDAWGSWDTFDHPLEYEAFITQVLSQCYRVLKPGGSLYIFTAREWNAYFIQVALRRGFVFRNVVAMAKQNPLPSFSKSNYRSGFELAAYLVKPEKPVTATESGQSGKHGATFNFLSQADCKNVYSYMMHPKIKHTKHPTEKPQELIERMVAISSNPGDLVLDPFMGSGTTAVAAKRLDRDYIGFDTNPAYIKMANERLKGVHRGESLPPEPPEKEQLGDTCKTTAEARP